MNNTDFACCGDDNTSYTTDNDIEDVIQGLLSYVKKNSVVL